MKIKDIPPSQVNFLSGVPFFLGPWIRGKGDVIGFRTLSGEVVEISVSRTGPENVTDVHVELSDVRMGAAFPPGWGWGDLDIIYIKEALRYAGDATDTYHYKVTNIYFTERDNVLQATVPQHPITIGGKRKGEYIHAAPLIENKMRSLGLEKAFCLEEYLLPWRDYQITEFGDLKAYEDQGTR